jgi:superfamily II DNA or RNA helicase
MKLQLRDYQQDLISRIYQSWESGNRKVLAQLPTGGGKTIVLSAIIDRAMQTDLKCLVLAHRAELINQAVDKLEAITDRPVGVIKSGIAPNFEFDIQCGSVQSCGSRLSKYPEFDLIVIDEAHHATSKSYINILDRYPSAKILGVTATPIRLDGKGFRGVFDDLICGVTIDELTAIGSLCDYDYYGAQNSMQTEGLVKRGGDYSTDTIVAVNPSDKVANQVVESYAKHFNGKQAIVFATTCEHSDVIARHLRLAGISAHHLDGTTPTDERQSVMDLFRNKEIQVLTNCALFDEGLDIPGLDGVILARPTASVSRYLQMIGRALRPAHGKDRAIVIDIANNYTRLGLPNDARRWTLDGLDRVKQSDKSKLVRNPETDKIEQEIRIAIASTSTEYIKIAGRSYQRNSELDAAIAKIDAIISEGAARGYKPQWCVYRLMDLAVHSYVPAEAWNYIGSKLGYHHKWASYKIEEFSQPNVSTAA